MRLPFAKMHGLGNDFIVVDATAQAIVFLPGVVERLSNRRTGIGFDQLLVLEQALQDGVDFGYRIFNADGTEVGQCGNGARCIGQFIQRQGLSDKRAWVLQTKTAKMEVESMPSGQFRVHLDKPVLSWLDMSNRLDGDPVLRVGDREYLFFAVNVGNPHIVIEVNTIEEQRLLAAGKWVNNSPFFSEGANVGFVKFVDRGHVELQVYERGAGLTLACGSGACAAAVMAVSQKDMGDRVIVDQKGGRLVVRYAEKEGIFFMEGPAQHVYSGFIDIPC